MKSPGEFQTHMPEEPLLPTAGRRQVARAAALGAAWLAMRQPSNAATASVSGTFLDAREFGARGDGKTDDTRSIQSAIDAAAARGGAVFLPPGVYLTSEVHMRPHVSLTGVPAWDYEQGFGSVLRLADPQASCLLNLTGAFGVTIDGLSLDGRKLGSAVHGVWLNKPDYGKQEDTFRIERCQIANFSGDGVRLTRAWCFSIRHSMIAYNGGDGISLRGWDGFFMDNWFSGNHGAGFAAREENASCTFTGNRIEWNREGIVIVGGDGYNITGNFFDRAGPTGLAILGGVQMSITGNFVKRSGKSAKPGTHDSSQIRLERARGITCSANNLLVGRDDGGKGQWSPSYGIVYKELQNCVISNNVLHDGALEQLMLDLGGHKEGAVVKDNPGRLAKPRT
ncbi:MAG: right-handed parallel beta-helix repeat-containing protein [Bryobacteraceae bacterium]